jgi:phosphate transport system substrate-binding protein
MNRWARLRDGVLGTSLRKKMLRIVVAVALSAVLLPLAGCGYASRAAVVAAGSTSVQPFAEILAEDYMKLNAGLTVDVQGGGSAAGILAAESGTADIGMSSRSLIGDETKLWSVEIARDGLALIVNPKNPVSSLSLAQARDIYAGSLKNWSELGGGNSRIHVVAREDGSGTRGSFESMVMGKTQIAATSIVQDSNGAVRQVVASDPDAIGFLSLGLVDKTVKAVELEGVAATRENVLNGTYGLSRPFLFVSKEQPTGHAEQFVEFTLSAEGRRILDAEGLITGGTPTK